MFFALRDHIKSLKWAPGQRILGAAGGNGRFVLYDPEKKIRLRQFGYSNDSDHFEILSICWFPSPTKQLVALGGTSGCAEVWDARTGTLLHSYGEHSPEVNCLPQSAYPYRRSVYALAWSPNRTYIASAGDDSLVRVWRATTGETCCVVSEGPVRAGGLLTWLADNTTLVSGVGSEIIVWDAFSGRIINRFKTPIGYEYSGCRAISPDGTKIAIATGKVVIYDLATGEAVLTYTLPDGEPTEQATLRYPNNTPGLVAWSPDGTKLATTFHRQRKRISIWDAVTGKTFLERASHAPVACLDWSTDSLTLAWGGDGYLETFDIPRR